MEITYQPSGAGGYSCGLTGSRGLRVTVISAAGETKVEARPEELPLAALVAAVEQYGEHEFGRRRTRNEKKRHHHEKQAASWRAAAEHLGQLLSDLTGERERAWCSGCFTNSAHRLAAARTRFGTRQYVCEGCGAPTGWCDVPRCDNFANRGDMPRKAQRFCAEHNHDIPSFETLEEHLPALEDYRDWLDFERLNASSASRIAVASLAGAAVLIPAAVVAAPAIGGAIGVQAGLSGAAATSHGLAVLGGGSLAAGGLGMAGGTMLVAAGGAGLGSAMGAGVAAAYVGDDKSFGFEKVADGDDLTVIFANGFLSERQRGWGSWERMIQNRYPDATVYRVTWGAKELRSLTTLVGGQVPAYVTRRAAEKLVVQALREGPRLLGPLGGVLASAGLLKNPWHVAKTKATMTGAVLADAIVRTDLQSVVLVGFSLGARVMVAAAESLGTRSGAQSGPRIQSMHLLGAAVGVRRDWHAIERTVDEKVWNYWSENDRILRYLYRAGDVGAKAVGCEGIPIRSPRIKNVKVSSVVSSHKAYLDAVNLR